MLKRIILHWTAGVGFPNKTDKEHYHFLIDMNGNIHKGRFAPEDNISCTDKKYAEHTGGGNTGSIGVAMCGMFGFKDRKNSGKFPLTIKQIEACFELVAGLCIKYQILPEDVQTHYEFGNAHPETSSMGKIDIIYLPPFPDLKKHEIGSFIRKKVYWYMLKLLKERKNQCVNG